MLVPYSSLQYNNALKWVKIMTEQKCFRIGMWRSSNSNSSTFELRTFSSDSNRNSSNVLSAFLLYDWFHMYNKESTAASECRQTYFSKIQPIPLLNYVSYWMCNIICCSAMCHSVIPVVWPTLYMCTRRTDEISGIIRIGMQDFLSTLRHCDMGIFLQSGSSPERVIGFWWTF